MWGVGIGVIQRVQAERLFDEIEDAPEIMVDMGNISRLGIRRDDDLRHSEPINISRSPAFAIIDDLWRRYMIVPVIRPTSSYRAGEHERCRIRSEDFGQNAD